MKKKGFTLIEVLAVIVLLGIIMFTVVPNILKTFNNSKEKTFKINLEKLYDATEVYKNEYELLYGRVLRNTTLEIVNNKIEGNPLSLKGKLPKSGSILIDELGQISLVAYDNGFCGEKLFNDPEVIVSTLSEEECQLYNVKDYEIVAKDFNVLRGNNENLLEHAYLSRYNEKVTDAVITYTSKPEFNYSKVGKYEVTYSSIYKDKSYEKTIVVSVEKDDFELPVLAISNSIGYYQNSGKISITAVDLFGLSNENIYEYYLSTSDTKLENGEWKKYNNGEMFDINGVNQIKYLWVYPVKDNSENVNDNKIFGTPYVIGTYYFDNVKPNIVAEGNTIYGDGTVTLTLTDELSGISENNNYKYYLSTSATELINGEWKTYENEKEFQIHGINETKYLWIYPIKDRSGNINDNHLNLNTPYVIASYTFDVPYTLTINDGISGQETTNLLFPGDTLQIQVPVREGYTFDGWLVTGEGSVINESIFTMGTSDTTITAKWQANTYAIKYNCNGGSGSTATSTHMYGVEQSLSKNGCYKITTGSSGMVYYLKGWSETSTATEATYKDRAVVKNLVGIGEMTLYAVWAEGLSYDKGKTIIDDGNGNWRIKFLDSGTLKVNSNLRIDIFLVGGGGGGSYGSSGGGGGGGGYTFTKNNYLLDSTQTYTITIGAGGAVNGNGGTTSAFTYSIGGGKAASGYGSGAGGSGGGGGSGYGKAGGNGGYNGNNGSGGGIGTGGTGQGSTTREFGESTGELYAGGGGGSRATGGSGGGGHGYGSSPMNGTDGYGGGGGGGHSSSTSAGKGGKGVVVIRNVRNVADIGIDIEYTGDYETIDDGNGNWRVKFKTSGTLTSKSTAAIDIFLVGGGGAGSHSSSGGGGGGGGYTLTKKNYNLEKTTYSIVVGAGGSLTSPNGKSSSAFGFTANGGTGGSGYGSGSGGSGGGGGSGYGKIGGKGGTDGGNGGSGSIGSGGTGQGSTTREFGESTGTLYSGGGGASGGASGGAGGGGNGYGLSPIHATANTGGGGGGGHSDNSQVGLGGSGIVIIRNAR